MAVQGFFHFCWGSAGSAVRVYMFNILEFTEKINFIRCKESPSPLYGGVPVV